MHFTIKGMNSLGSLLTESANESLEYLDLSWNKFTWESRENLSFALLCNTTLLRLRLIGCEIDGNLIFEGLSLNGALKELYLDFNKILPKGIMNLCRALENNSSLLILNLDSCYTEDR